MKKKKWKKLAGDRQLAFLDKRDEVDNLLEEVKQLRREKQAQFEMLCRVREQVTEANGENRKLRNQLAELGAELDAEKQKLSTDKCLNCEMLRSLADVWEAQLKDFRLKKSAEILEWQKQFYRLVDENNKHSKHAKALQKQVNDLVWSNRVRRQRERARLLGTRSRRGQGVRNTLSPLTGQWFVSLANTISLNHVLTEFERKNNQK